MVAKIRWTNVPEKSLFQSAFTCSRINVLQTEMKDALSTLNSASRAEPLADAKKPIFRVSASVIGGASTIRFVRKSGDEEPGIVKDPFEPETFTEKTPGGSQTRLNLLGAGVMRLILPASMTPAPKVSVDCASGSVRVMIGRTGPFVPSAALVVITLGRLKVLASLGQ